jgi:hypothetical protein
MKKIKIIYWVSTVLFSAFMLLTSIAYVVPGKDVVLLLHDQLGYPLYIIPFIGIAKIVASIVLVIPGIPRMKEWAYAGLIIDLTGALYSLLMIGGGMQAFVGMMIPILIGVISYLWHHKKLTITSQEV